MKIHRPIKILVMALFLFTSCEYEWIEPEQVPIPETVSFSADIMPIFNNGCNSSGVCHGASGYPPVLTEASAYNELFAGNFVDTITPGASILYVTMEGGSMEQYTTPGDEQIVLAWIEQGAKNN